MSKRCTSDTWPAGVRRSQVARILCEPRVGAGRDVPHGPLIEDLARRARAGRGTSAPRPGPHRPARRRRRDSAAAKQGAVSRLIQIYANRGHLVANIDPLGLTVRPTPKVLGARLPRADARPTSTPSSSRAVATRRSSRDSSCATSSRSSSRSIAARSAPNSRTSRTRPSACGCRTASRSAGMHAALRAASIAANILWHLTMAEGLERYLATRYPAQKRFSLEGGDSADPAARTTSSSRGGINGVEDIVFGMAHRGRLNVLVNVLGKSPEALFSEFEGKYDLKKLQGFGRRQVPQGLLVRRAHARRQRARGARLQPLAPRDRQSGRRRLGARAPGAPRRRAWRQGAWPCCSTATRRSPARASSWKRCRCRRRAGSTPAARST